MKSVFPLALAVMALLCAAGNLAGAEVDTYPDTTYLDELEVEVAPPEKNRDLPKYKRSPRDSWVFFTGGVRYSRMSFRLLSLEGRDGSGFALPGLEFFKPDHNQNFRMETVVGGLPDLGILYRSGNGHISLQVSLGTVRHRFQHRIGCPSSLRTSGSLSSTLSALSGWGGAVGARFEIASHNPLVPLSVLAMAGFIAIDLGIIAAHVAAKSSNSNYVPFSLSAMGISELGEAAAENFEGDKKLKIAPLFGFSTGFMYTDVPCRDESFFDRTLSGRWTHWTTDFSLFFGAYVGRHVILKAGGEFVEGHARARLFESGTDSETWKFRARNWFLGAFVEVILLRIYGFGLRLKASTVSGGTFSASLGVSF